MDRAESRSPDLYARLKRKIVEDRVFLLASAVTFNVLVTIVPFFLLVLSTVGVFAGRSSAARADVLVFVRTSLPLAPEAGRELLTTMVEAREWFGAVGLLGLLYASTRLFTSLRDVLEIVFDIPAEERLGAFRGRLHDARMVILVGTLFLLSVGVTGIVRSVGTRVGPPPAPGGPVWEVTTAVLGAVGGFALTVAMFWFLYRFVPGRRRIAPFDATIAAVFAGILFEVVKVAFVAWVVGSGRAERLYGPVAGIVVTTLWIHYSAIVFLLGAEIASARRWTRRRSTANVRSPRAGAIL